MTQATVFWTVAALGGALAGYGAIAERRHKKREDLDRVSLVNWSLVTMAGASAAIISLAYAIKMTLPAG